jgi:alkylation response protein AidB-like acyl-CoA dehydrogenase
MSLLLASDAPAEVLALPDALREIAARAGALDANPRFPTENIKSLRAVGALQLAADRKWCSLAAEIGLVRAVAAADASTARILDGHLNGVERLALGAPEELRETELELVREGELLLGVWGADPAQGEGAPARIERDAPGALVLRGVKTFCSGAGGVHRALVVALDDRQRRRLAYVDTSSGGLRIDRSWYRASGLRASESHRVEFDGAAVLTVFGTENELAHEPWFSRDGVRTAATWAGIADAILHATVLQLRDREPDEIQLHALGHMRIALGTIDRWLAHAGEQLSFSENPGGNTEEERKPGPLANECRGAITAAARTIAAQSARACGSRALVNGGPLDRARRDLDLFLLQHRLEPKLVSLGRATLHEAAE